MATDKALEVAAIGGLRSLIRLLGFDPDAPMLKDTPRRVVASLRLLGGLHERPSATSLLTPDPGEDGVQLAPYAGPVRVSSVCADHLAPYGGLVFLAHYTVDERRATTPARMELLPGRYAAALTTPRRLAESCSEAFARVLGGAGGCAVIRLTRPCPYLHDADDLDWKVPADVVVGWGVYRDGSTPLRNFLEWTRGQHPDGDWTLDHGGGGDG